MQALVNDNGDLIMDAEDIKKKWREYFKALLNCPSIETSITCTENIQENMNEVAPLSFQEVQKAIMRLKNVDEVPAEL